MIPDVVIQLSNKIMYFSMFMFVVLFIIGMIATMINVVTNAEYKFVDKLEHTCFEGILWSICAFVVTWVIQWIDTGNLLHPILF